jgi:hypothetical protein
MPITPDRRVATPPPNPCAAPFGAWLAVTDPVDHPLAERMTVRVLDIPAPFVEPSGCPLSQPKGSPPIKTRARSVYFTQGLPLGDGGFLAMSSSDPLIVRFDGELKAPFLDGDRRHIVIDYGADMQKQLEKSAVDQSKQPDAQPAAVIYEQQVWSLLQPGKPAAKPAPAAKPVPPTAPPKPAKPKPPG